MKILLVGFGKMNKLIFDLYEENIVGICDIYKEYINEAPDVIIDFSHKDYFFKLVELIDKFRCPVVIGTTNLEDEKMAQLQEISKNIPILISSNFSTGIYLLEKMFKENKNILSLFDKEIIETHHKDKIHSPSGTSLALADCLNTANITSIRIGDVVGVHEVILEKDYEVLSINHSVSNRCVYAIGAVNAARWLINKENGLYSFGNLYES
jgi:4-hydroxy-tetrahydrodipicolinate reductase